MDPEYRRRETFFHGMIGLLFYVETREEELRAVFSNTPGRVLIVGGHFGIEYRRGDSLVTWRGVKGKPSFLVT